MSFSLSGTGLALSFAALAALAGRGLEPQRGAPGAAARALLDTPTGVAIPGEALPASAFGPAVIESMEVALAREAALDPALDPERGRSRQGSLADPAQRPVGTDPAGTGRRSERLEQGLESEGEGQAAAAGASASAGTLPSLLVEFAGPNQNDPGANWIPPYTHGAVGTNHFVAVVNEHLSIYDKATTARVTNVSLQSFFGGNTSVRKGSPRVLYDHHADRWVLIASDFTSGIHFAWTTSGDPTASWFKTSIVLASGADAGTWPDFPTLGLDANGVYVGAHMVGNALSLFAIDKTPLLNLVPTIGTVTAWRSLFWEGALQPCLTYGNPPGCYVTSRFSASSQRIRRIDPPLTSPTLTQVGFITTKNGQVPPDAPALGSSVPLDTLDARHVNAVHRNGMIWLAHCVGKDGRAAINWYELDPVLLTVVQEGTVKSATDSYVYPSIAVNSAGDALVGFSASSPTLYAGAWYTGRRAADPPGEMAVPVQYKLGGGPYNQFVGGLNPWGYYSMTTVDPTDDLSFWTIQEHATNANTWGTHIAELAFTSCAPPSATQPASAVRCPGASVSFATTAGGTGPFSYQWRKDGFDISGANSSSYSIAAVTALDAGSYTCAVSDVCGSTISLPGVLTVNTPVSASDPADATRCPGTGVSFVTSAGGSGPFSYQWKKDGFDIGGATSSSHAIVSVAPADAGDYSVVVTGACGAVETAAATLTVLAPTTASDPLGATECPGAAVTFDTLAGGSGPFSYQWKKDGLDIGGATLSAYSLAAVAASDAGDYTVEVTGACGTHETAAATLVVLAPVSASDPLDSTGCPGTAVQFDTVAGGSGPFSYQWKKDGGPIGGATGSTYAIAALAPADAGDYSVEVTGACGTLETAAATLTVNQQTSATDPVDVKACPGTPASFHTTAGGTGPFSYQWKHDGAPIGGATASSYTIPSAAAGDVGDYAVEVTGACGTLQTAAARLTLGVDFTSYCTAGTSASGCQATITGTGTPSASQPSGFVVIATGVEGQKDGLFFFGDNGRQANSWGNGSSFQCIVPPLRRGGVLVGNGANGQCNGVFGQDLNARWQAKPNHNPGAGATVQVQLWYRDPANTSNQSTSFSDALEFPVCP